MSTAGPAERSSPGWNAKHKASALYRTPGITADHIARFVRTRLRELFEGEDSHYYDAVYAALRESGLHPLASLACEHLHVAVLNDWTVIAPDRHLTRDELTS